MGTIFGIGYWGGGLLGVFVGPETVLEGDVVAGAGGGEVPVCVGEGDVALVEQEELQEKENCSCGGGGCRHEESIFCCCIVVVDVPSSSPSAVVLPYHPHACRQITALRCNLTDWWATG